MKFSSANISSLFAIFFIAIGSRAAHLQPISTTSTIVQTIRQYARESQCAEEVFGKHHQIGTAPTGFIVGMALNFARDVCAIQKSELDQTIAVRSYPPTGDQQADALTYMGSQFPDSMNIHNGGLDTLRALYVLGLGFGMQESSGNYCAGYDSVAQAKNSGRTSDEVEAGPFQTSLSIVAADKSGTLKSIVDLYMPLLQNFKDAPQTAAALCMTNLFQMGDVTCDAKKIEGDGAEGQRFQKLEKSCPRFAVDLAMTSLRLVRWHYGPINRKTMVPITATCNTMFRSVQDYVKENPRVCQTI